MSRRPAGLVSPPLARLVGYALLATIGSLQWVRYVHGASSARAVAWAVAGTLTGALVLAAGRLRPTRPRASAMGLILAPLAGMLLAAGASGLALSFLEPGHWDELGNGLGRGADTLNTVRLPYLGREPWVLTTVQLSGAAVCWAAAVLAAWPRGGGARIAALGLLLVLVAAPVVSLGVPAGGGVYLGLGLAVLTAAFLWLERLARRPGLGLAALAAVALLAAVPLGAAADREEPWFDYKAFSESLGGGASVSFQWDHDYGPIDWPRDGVELFRVRSADPHYWKAETLNYFDGREWTSSTRAPAGGDRPVDDLPRGGNPHPEWDARFSVALRRLRTPDVIGAGTVLGVTDSTLPVQEGTVPGQWTTAGLKDLSKGDSYTVRAHIPRPTAQQLAAATVGRDPRRAGSLSIHVGFRRDAAARGPMIPPYPGGAPVRPYSGDVQFAPYETGRKPVAQYPQIAANGSGAEALRSSYYDRTWALSQRLRARSISPYDYLLRVNAYLRGPDFAYTEVPPPTGDEPPLESFLLDTKRGYCQQFSGAMVLLLRMGGIPARVAAGFSPGGLRSASDEWVVRDTDAHSWVEAWFDGLGWVTFDPTPPQTPARSQIAAINPPKAGGRGASRSAPSAFPKRRPEGPPSAPLGAPGRIRPSGGPSVWLLAGFGVLGALLLSALALAVRARRRAGAWWPSTTEAALAELERALRRTGRAAPAGMTLSQLERRLGIPGDGYLRALRAARYRPGAPEPSREQRAAFRRELAIGLGWRGKLLGYWALPPLPPRPPAPPRTLRSREPR